MALGMLIGACRVVSAADADRGSDRGSVAGKPASAAADAPGRAWTEPAAVARLFPDPPAVPRTPGLQAGRSGFTSHAELLAFLAGVAAVDASGAAARWRIVEAGRSVEGRAIPLVILPAFGAAQPDPARPTVLVVAQQHGDEPAGGEAALALLLRWRDAAHAAALPVNLLVMPRVNPDGAEHGRRLNAQGVDINRDHLRLASPEAQAVSAVIARHAPAIVVDLHETPAAGRWLAKFGVIEREDALLQVSSVPNLMPAVQSLQQRYRRAAEHALAAIGHRVGEYRTTSPDAADLRVEGGSLQPDTLRNLSGLRHSVGLLVETRGIGLGRAHLARRVASHLGVLQAVIDEAGHDGKALQRQAEAAGRQSGELACVGDMVLAEAVLPQPRPLRMLEPLSGQPRTIEVTWMGGTPRLAVLTRDRPCGYLLPPQATDTANRLRRLGLRVGTLATEPAAAWTLEPVDDAAAGARQRLKPPAGSHWVSLAQPWGLLAALALEPDVSPGPALGDGGERLPADPGHLAASGPGSPAGAVGVEGSVGGGLEAGVVWRVLAPPASPETLPAAPPRPDPALNPAGPAS